MKKEKNKGITLIALVITIIVLLILAGITISTLIGENGVLTKAQIASQQTEIEDAKEQAKVDIADWIAEKLQKGESADLNNEIVRGILTGRDYVKNAGEESFTTSKNEYVIPYEILYSNASTAENGVKPGQKVEDNNKEYENNGKAIIPVGFCIVPGCEDVSQGLVISDDERDTEKDPNNKVAYGNQFVWIPVTETTKYEKNTTYYIEGISKSTFDSSDYLPEGIDNEEQAVKTKGGFFIARYETGEDENDNLVSKKGAMVATYNVSGSSLQINYGKKIKEWIQNDYVKSALITGTQWDVAMDFISSQTRTDGTGEIFDILQGVTARHKGSPSKSGENEADKVCNIYDLEGNYQEYTGEKTYYTSSNNIVVRGGSARGYGSSYIPKGQRAAAMRSTIPSNGAVASRSVLYVVGE